MNTSFDFTRRLPAFGDGARPCIRPALRLFGRAHKLSAMAVYVDSARHPFKGHMMCHMTADSLEDLHDMARCLEMKRAWFQAPPKASFPHYDIPAPRRARAIDYGALEVDSRTSLYFAAKLGIEWARLHGDDRRLARYQQTLKRAAKHVPAALMRLEG